MSEPLKPYPAYKPAAVPWLQQVPEHWGEMKVKYIFRERVQKGYPNEPLLAATQSKGVVTKEAYGLRTVEAQKDLHLLKLVEKGDFVISLRSFQGGIEVSYARGIISPAYTILRTARPCDPGYLKFLLKSAPFIDGLKLFITGIREGQNIDYLRLARTPLPWPSLVEQHLIVRYLHALDAKVKRYIRTKRTLIARLQEQKQAIIQRTVTRGLDPNVKLKPSGVEWLGEVPEHWEVSLVKQVGLVRFSGVDKLTHNWETKVLLCNYTDVYRNDFIDRSIDFMQASATQNEINKFTLRAGDVLLTKDSETADDIAVPTCVVEDLDGVLCGYHLALIRPFKQKAVGEFLFRALTAPTIAKQFHLAANGVTRYALGKDAVKNGYLAMPPFEEQQRICESINTMFQPINKSIEQLKKEIGHITEYHTRLIADVVTGAVDVTAAAKAMAVETEEVMEEEPLSMAAEGEEEH
jgi:type I restriction enzyme S subunit